MWAVSASASGYPGDDGTPRNAGRGGRADAGHASPPAGGGSAGRGDTRAEDLSQEQILDLVVEAMVARGGPGAEDDDLGDEDDGDAGRCWDTRDVPGPPDADEQNSGPGPGFGSDQPLDALRPGPVLAGEADRVHTGALRAVSDDELTGMIKAWRRLTSWATARELGAIAEFARRRPEEDTESDFARHVRARRAASGPPAAAKQAGSAQPPAAVPAAGVNPAAPGADPAAQAAAAVPAAGVNPAAPAAPADAAAEAGAPAGGWPGAEAGFPEVISAFASYELSLALTLTGRSAEAYLDFAVELVTKLPKTLAALEAGQIDIIRARIIAEATHVLSNEHTAAVEDLIFPRAGQQTSGQLRAALARAVLAADPDAARRRREHAQRDARVLRWREDAGTAALCGRDLPSAEVLAADQRISARARQLRSAGVTGTLDELRARAYLDFLLGRDSTPQHPSDQPQPATPPGEYPAGGPPAGNPPAGGPPAGDPAASNPAAGGPPAGNPAASDPAAGGPPAGEPRACGMPPGAGDGPRVPPWTAGGPPGSLAARINVTVPLATILGLSDTPGDVAAFGPVDADVTRDLIRAAGLHPATRWCVTVVAPDGQAAGHGCAHGRHQAPAFPPDGDNDPPPGTGGKPSGTGGSPPGSGGSPPGGGDGPPGSSGGPGGDGPGGGNRTPHNVGGQPGPRHRPGEPAPGPASFPALNLQARTFIERLGVQITPLAAGTCDHRNQEPGYTLSPRLRHLIAARTVCCCAPGCRRPAARCDYDHTIAYQAGGRSCECNVRPLCRRHHRCKQAQGWAVDQPDPGTMTWTTPAGRTYTTRPTIYHL